MREDLRSSNHQFRNLRIAVADLYLSIKQKTRDEVCVSYKMLY